MVFVTAAYEYGMGSVVVQATVTNNTWTATQLWYKNDPSAHWMTPVASQGFLYGQFGIQFQFDSPNAQLKCVDMRTGAVKWSTNGFGRGATLLVDNHLLVITEKGELVLAQTNTDAYIEVGRFRAIPNYFGDTNKCWNGPAVADGRVYVRSTSFGACFDLSVPNLKLDAPQPSLTNKFQLTVRTVDGTPIDSNRLPGMELRATTNPALAPPLWTALTNALILTNGVIRVTNLDGVAAPKRFFLISEPD